MFLYNDIMTKKVNYGFTATEGIHIFDFFLIKFLGRTHVRKLTDLFAVLLT